MAEYKEYKNQQHSFTSYSGFVNQKFVNVSKPPFLVKEIKFDFAYNFKSAGDFSNITVSSPLADGELVGFLSKMNYVYNDGKQDIYAYNDGFRSSKAISFIPKYPINIPEQIIFNFANIFSGTISDFTCTIHVEFLGY